MSNVKKGDSVILIAGAHKWSTAEVTHVSWDYVLLEWINIKKKAQKNEWFVEKIAPVHISNCAKSS